jgi:hypothetical protein
MRKSLSLTVAVAGLLLLQIPSSAFAGQGVEWKQIIGIIQAGNIVGSGAGKVTGGGQPWSTIRGTADVDLESGELQFRVQGLVLAGGNAIGTPDNVTQVKGTLVCDTTGSATGDSTLVDTELVPLSAQGDARFNGNVAPLPDACVSSPNIAFLIRTAGGAWLANGAVRVVGQEKEHRGHDD